MFLSTVVVGFRTVEDVLDRTADSAAVVLLEAVSMDVAAVMFLDSEGLVCVDI